MEHPGDEITFLKRLHVLYHDGRMTIQTHAKHISQLCTLLGMNPKVKNKKSPAHSDIDRRCDHVQDMRWHLDVSGQRHPSLSVCGATSFDLQLKTNSKEPHRFEAFDLLFGQPR